MGLHRRALNERRRRADLRLTMWRIPPPDGRSGYGDPMPIRRSAAPLALLAALALAGCTAPDPEPTPTAAPTTEPLFASEEEALAAAEEAYSEYVHVVDQILQEGGSEAGRIEEVASGDAMELQLAGFSEAEERGLRSVGNTTFAVDSVQSWTPDATEVISLFVCQDVSATDLINEVGESIIDPDRPTLLPREVGFAVGPADRLIIVRDELWLGTNYC